MVWGKGIAEAKINDLDVLVLIEQEILRFEIPMNHRVLRIQKQLSWKHNRNERIRDEETNRVAIVQSRDNLPEKYTGLLFLDTLVSHNVIKELQETKTKKKRRRVGR